MPRSQLQRRGEVRVGVSGWRYAPWRGVFYPTGLRTADQLEFTSRLFSSIELNGSFYSLQRPESYRAWSKATPQGFVFAIKGSRYVSHLKRLKQVELGLANFFASGLLDLEEKLGPILWQLPPNFAFDEARLKHFFELLPRTHGDAALLARQHGPRLAGRVSFGAGGKTPIRYALEFRHESFVTPKTSALFKAHRIAPCVADAAGLFPTIEDLCADFVYVRLHGAEQLYTSGYSHEELRAWAARIRRWRVGRPAEHPRQADPKSRGNGKPHDVFVYFDNDVKVRAPFDALNLHRIVQGLEPQDAPDDLLRTVTEEPRTEWPAWRRVTRARRTSRR
jgi:uncharacterized protein YecE (DUF72 family)